MEYSADAACGDALAFWKSSILAQVAAGDGANFETIAEIADRLTIAYCERAKRFSATRLAEVFRTAPSPADE